MNKFLKKYILVNFSLPIKKRSTIKMQFDLWRQMCSSLTNLNLSVSSGSYYTSIIVGSIVYSNALATLFTHYPTVWAVKCSVVGTRVLAVL